MCLAEWRIPHLHPVLHQLPAVSVSVCVVAAVRAPVILSGSHLHMLPSQPLTWLHCATAINALPFFPPSRQPDTLHTRHLGRSQSVWVLLRLGLRLPHTTRPHTLHLFHSFILRPIDRVAAHMLTDGGITAVSASRWELVMFYCASVVLWDTSIAAKQKTMCWAFLLPACDLYIHTVWESPAHFCFTVH